MCPKIVLSADGGSFISFQNAEWICFIDKLFLCVVFWISIWPFAWVGVDDSCKMKRAQGTRDRNYRRFNRFILPKRALRFTNFFWTLFHLSCYYVHKHFFISNFTYDKHIRLKIFSSAGNSSVFFSNSSRYLTFW